jgi:hypothetical protein
MKKDNTVKYINAFYGIIVIMLLIILAKCAISSIKEEAKIQVAQETHQGDFVINYYTDFPEDKVRIANVTDGITGETYTIAYPLD